MRARTLAVLHRDPLIADALACALGRFPTLMPEIVGSDLGRLKEMPVDAAVIDGSLEGASFSAGRLRRQGVRVFVMPASTDDESVRIGSVSALASALAPGSEMSTVRLARLSARERQVLTLAASGMAGKQIGASLGISPKTVEAHKTRIFGKLGVPSQTAAVALMTSFGGGGAWTR